MISDLYLHKAEDSDFPEVVELLKICTRGLYSRGIDQWDDLYPTQEIFSDDLRSGTLFLCRLEGKLAGAIVFNEVQDPVYLDISWNWTTPRIGVIHRLMVHPEFQGQGLAKRIMTSIEVKAVKQGYVTMRLDAFTGNPPALRLYPLLGYAPCGTIQLRKGSFLCFEKRLA